MDSEILIIVISSLPYARLKSFCKGKALSFATMARSRPSHFNGLAIGLQRAFPDHFPTIPEEAPRSYYLH